MAELDSGKLPVVLITGGTSGVGLQTSLRFAQAGFQIAICGRDKQRLEQAAKSMVDAGASDVFAVEHDLSDPSKASFLAEQVIERFGRVDLLVNNAAVAPLGKLDETSDEEFEKTINVNIRSVFYLTRQIWTQMKKQQSGTIINISSLAAVDPFPGFSVYGSSKAWIDLFTVALGNEGKECGIQVFSIRAGAVETPLLRGLFPDFPADQAIHPERIADVIWMLFQKEMKPASGQAIVVKQ